MTRYTVWIGSVFADSPTAHNGKWDTEIYVVDADSEAEAYTIATTSAQEGGRDAEGEYFPRYLVHTFLISVSLFTGFTGGDPVFDENPESTQTPHKNPLDWREKQDLLRMAEKPIARQLQTLPVHPRCRNSLLRNISEAFFLDRYNLMPFDIWCERVLSGDLDSRLLRTTRGFGPRSLDELKRALKSRQEQLSKINGGDNGG